MIKTLKQNSKRLFYKHKVVTRVTSMLLVFTLLFTSLPLGGIVASAADVNQEDTLITVEKELTEYRTEYSKTYLMSNGTLESVISANPMHYKNAGGNWQDIDSTLVLEETEDGEVYKNKAGGYAVYFPTKNESGSSVKIESGEHTIEIELVEGKKSHARKDTSNKNKAKKLTKEQRKIMTASELYAVDSNQNSALEYNEVYDNTNIRYDINPTSVKESVIITKAPNKKVSYSYNIKADGLVAQLNNDGSVAFYEKTDTKKQTAIFVMPAPLMYDANDIYCYDIETTLKQKKGIYTLTYKPDYNWLKSKDRAYPVVLDPTTYVANSTQDAYTYSADEYQNRNIGSENQIKVGRSTWKDPNGDTFETFIRFDELPTIPDGYVINSALLMLTTKAYHGTWQELEVGVHKVTEDWTNKLNQPLPLITYLNQPDAESFPRATAHIVRGDVDTEVGFEISALVNEWYEDPTTNYGVKLSLAETPPTDADNVLFHSSRATSGIPYLSITYDVRVPVTDIEITEKCDQLDCSENGYNFEVGALVYPVTASDQRVNWQVADESVAYYYDGKIYARGNGETTVTAISVDDNTVTDSFDLEVTNVQAIAADNFSIINLPKDNKLDLNTTHTLGTVAMSSDTEALEIQNENITWQSSNAAVATINPQGEITPVSLGTTVITATFAGATANFTLTVIAPEVTAVDFGDLSDMIIVGNTVTFTGMVYPANAGDVRTTCEIIEYSDYFDNAQELSIATITENSTSNAATNQPTQFSITANDDTYGVVTLRLKSVQNENIYKDITVYVVLPEQAALGLRRPKKDMLTKGETWRMSENPNISVSLSDNSILRYDYNGYFTALAEGTTEVDINDGFNHSHFEIRVIGDYNNMSIIGTPFIYDDDNSKIPNTMYVNQSNYELGLKNGPTDLSQVNWSSSDPTVATIDYEIKSGRQILTALKSGETIISATVEGTESSASFLLAVIDETPGEITKVSLSVPSNSKLDDRVLYIGETGTINATIYPLNSNTRWRPVFWYEKSSEEGIIKIATPKTYLISEGYATGRFIGLKEGQVDVSASADIPESNFISITVKEPKINITNQPYNGCLGVGATFSMQCVAEPSNSTVTWGCKNTNFASITNSGVITANFVGLATFYVKSVYYGYDGPIEITYNYLLNIVELDEINIEGNTSLAVGSSCTLTTTAEPNSPFFNNALSAVDWTTSNSNIATVNADGKVTAKNAGAVTIRATSKLNNLIFDEKTITTFFKQGVTILNVPDDNILYINNLENPNNAHQLSAHLLQDGASIQSISWNTSNSSIATVDSLGVVTAKSIGTVSITCTVNGTIVSDPITLKIKNYTGAADEYVPSDSRLYNCYAHVLGETVWRNVGGGYGGDMFWPESFEVEFIADLVEDDILAEGWGIRRIEAYNSPISSDEYRIALRTGERDYHFMLQHNNGLWSHKIGKLRTKLFEWENPSTQTWDRPSTSFVSSSGELEGWNYIENYYDSYTVYFAITK